jgi:outer membrane protein OmpA-like peptidoglycan-associated protein
MGSRALFTAVASLAIGLLAIMDGRAQSGPSPEQIVKSLSPTGASGATRGIRITPSTAAQAHAPSHAAPTINLSVLFATGSADLTPEAVHVLDSLGKALNDQALAGYRFRIEGHTDTVGTREYNQELSDRRATAVLDYLADNFHVDRSRVEAVGKGEDDLLIPTPDQTPEPRNRRVQVVNIGS